MGFAKLYQKLETTDICTFYKVDVDLLLETLQTGKDDLPDCLRTYSTISQWFGTSLRSGAWTYYEIEDVRELQLTTQYLSSDLWEELYHMFCLGTHVYQSLQFIGNFNYPHEWIDESSSIDEWIMKNEQKLYEQQGEFLPEHRDEICAL